MRYMTQYVLDVICPSTWRQVDEFFPHRKCTATSAFSMMVILSECHSCANLDTSHVPPVAIMTMTTGKL
jgi:hypothetical protein